MSREERRAMSAAMKQEVQAACKDARAGEPLFRMGDAVTVNGYPGVIAAARAARWDEDCDGNPVRLSPDYDVRLKSGIIVADEDSISYR